jgi:hypothetical protein
MHTFNRKEEKVFFELLDGNAKYNKTNVPGLVSLIKPEGNFSLKNVSSITSQDTLHDFLKNRYENGIITKPSIQDVEKYAVNGGYDLSSEKTNTELKPEKIKLRRR